MSRPLRQLVPDHLTRPSRLKTFLLIFRCLALWLVPALVSCVVLKHFESLNVWYFAILLFFGFLSGNGLHTLGLVGHEGTHFSLHRKRRVSALIGVVASSAVPFHIDMGFALSHARHHKFTNTNQDPDVKVFGSFRSFWSRLLFARPAASREYLLLGLKLATKRWPRDEDTYINLPYEDLVMLARLNFAVSLAFLFLYFLIFWMNPLLFLTVVVMPTFMGILISGLRPYIEHTDTGIGKFDNARSWISPMFNFLFAGVNFHLAHHLYPGIASYHLPELHAWLESTRQITKETSQTITTWREVFEVVRSKHKYPDGVA